MVAPASIAGRSRLRPAVKWPPGNSKRYVVRLVGRPPRSLSLSLSLSLSVSLSTHSDGPLASAHDRFTSLLG